MHLQQSQLLRLSGAAFALSALFCSIAPADVLSLEPERDNTMYEDSPGTNSNGSGSYIFAGFQASNGWSRRALLRFDLSAIPAGSTVNSVQLSLYVTQTITGPDDFDLHRVTRDWGEAGSDAPGQEGGGTTAQNGDATWVTAFHPSTSWGLAGGDFITTASATASVDAVGTTSVWSAAGLTADVQSMINGALPNFGWLLKHTDEIQTTPGVGNAKRFASREGSILSQRPILTVDFTLPVSEPGQSFCAGDGSGSACPCANFGAAGEGCSNDTGSGALLSASGSNSISADDLVLDASNLTQGPGLFFQGDNAVNSANGNPFGDGLRCAGGSVKRLEVQFANAANSFTASSTISVSVAGAVSAGQTKRYQYWYRDSGTSPCSSLFNLSNGYEITWSL